MLRQFFSQRTEHVQVEAGITQQKASGRHQDSTSAQHFDKVSSAQAQRRTRLRQSVEDCSRNLTTKLHELGSDPVGSEPTTIGAHLSHGSLMNQRAVRDDADNIYLVSSIDNSKEGAAHV